MSFKVDGVTYSWQRGISQVQTEYSIVTQSRKSVPDELGCFWYGPANPDLTCYVPLYPSMTKLSSSISGPGAGAPARGGGRAPRRRQKGKIVGCRSWGQRAATIPTRRRAHNRQSRPRGGADAVRTLRGAGGVLQPFHTVEKSFPQCGKKAPKVPRCGKKFSTVWKNSGLGGGFFPRNGKSLRDFSTQWNNFAKVFPHCGK